MSPTVDADVYEAARHFGVDPLLIQAVVNAEGGGDHIIAAVRCSVPSVATRGEALMILCRSAVHALSDYVKATQSEPFVAFFAHRWAPLGVANDPTNLNANFAPNVLKLWRGDSGAPPTAV